MSLLDDIEAGFLVLANEINNKACRSEVSGSVIVSSDTPPDLQTYKLWFNEGDNNLYINKGSWVNISDDGYF